MESVFVIRKQALLGSLVAAFLLLPSAAVLAQDDLLAEEAAEEEIVDGEGVETDAAQEACLVEGTALDLIQQERQLLDERRERLDQEESRLDLARARIETDMEHLMALKEEVGTILATAEERHSDDLERLVNLYGNMRAKEAAAIVNLMDLGSAVELISAIPERQSAPILQRMDPQKAQAISRVLLDRNRLPGDRQLPDVN